jgi:hypothetical protein
MDTKKELKSIRVNDPEAIRLVRENAPKQRRSLSACASVAIITVLGRDDTINCKSKQEKTDVALGITMTQKKNEGDND